MKKLIGGIKIEYWWREETNKHIPKNHRDALHETAQERIYDMLKEGYTSGELQDNVFMNDSDTEDGVSYFGWWEIKS